MTETAVKTSAEVDVELTPNLEFWSALATDLIEGGHLQTTGQLGYHDEASGAESYCCLGRGCEVAKAQGVDVSKELYDEAILYGGDSGLPPRAVRLHAGVENWVIGVPQSSLDDYSLDEDEEDQIVPIPLYELNDEHHWSFKTIGLAIRDHFKLEN